MSPIEKAAEALKNAGPYDLPWTSMDDPLKGFRQFAADCVTAYLEACAEHVPTRERVTETICEHEPTWDNQGQARAAILALVPGRE